MTKILLVEDDKNLREIYGTRLYAEGYDIVSAGDGEAALAMAIKEHPDLIISDVMMPKISGFDMLDILRSTTETKNIPVIMMTALSSEDQQARGEALGANRYLVKSQVGIEDVVRTVHEVLQDAPGMQPGDQFKTTPSAMPRSDNSGVSVPERQPTQQQQQQPPQPQQQAQATQEEPQQPQAQQQQSPQQPQQQAGGTTVNQPTAQDSPDNGSLPRPIAPFSTQRPAGLGDRVIHPIERPTDEQAKDTVAEKMAAALSSNPNASLQAQPQPQQTPQPQQQSPSMQPLQQAQPQPQQQSADTALPYELPSVEAYQQPSPQPQHAQQNGNQQQSAPGQNQTHDNGIQPDQATYQQNPQQPQQQPPAGA